MTPWNLDQPPKQNQSAKKRRPGKKYQVPKQWSMYPALHGKVQQRLADAGLAYLTFHPHDTDTGKVRDYDTTIMGRFVCRNRNCETGGWSSKAVAIRIRMYPDGKYNARVYHQRCRGCNALSRPFLNASSYAERVAYRLKKWHGILVTPPAYGGASQAPHNEELCEGCKAGHCFAGKRWRGEDVEELSTAMAAL
ncbi:hypothetical protein BO82DRAFT_419720 [Aspergillus uvarum CBS 121591]|uniref:3CxxC-type domain-containing protein n=1 Tax=Aspergillus uvarum CBS 121591 TaxID=1448315 RepID=A0A319C6G8_9EURO|nr:hypothetical protein BO82DRAFT_419720 [Aspergillus uvarum CBS 121591]PYH79590.1 hypothetical protein BO82DRAFT_419720 [Aspergillus uvarum CBS 121591]